MKTLKSVSVVSSQEGIQQIEAEIDHFFSTYKLPETLYGNLLVAVVEAAINAIKHGNKNDVNKIVKVDFGANNNQLCVCITDQGNGFDFKALPDPTQPDNIEKFEGRGVFLMKNLADDVDFNEIGNVVKLYFNLLPDSVSVLK